MKTSDVYIDELFDFKGQWGIPSRCGVKIFRAEAASIVIVTELYQDNPGSSITSIVRGLFQQVCEHYDLNPHRVVYVECAPGMNSKLSFYDQQFYLVDFTPDGCAHYTVIDNFATFLAGYND